MPAKTGGVPPMLLPALGGMFVISLIDAVGMISTSSPLGLAVYAVTPALVVATTDGSLSNLS